MQSPCKIVGCCFPHHTITWQSWEVHVRTITACRGINELCVTIWRELFGTDCRHYYIIEQRVVWVKCHNRCEKIWIMPMFDGQRIKYFLTINPRYSLISLWLINITTHLDYNLCTLVIVVSGYLCIYIQFKWYFGWALHILHPMLKCPVRNNFTCPVRNAMFF